MPTITRDAETRDTVRLDANDWADEIVLSRSQPEEGLYNRVRIPAESLRALHDEIGKVLEARATRQKNLEWIASLTPDRIVQSYSGKPGCACGCKGNYSVRPATIKLVLSRLQDAAPYARNRDIMVGSNSQGGMFFSVETETDKGTPRVYTVYAGQGWVD